ncbi:MAG: hypothetical protein QME42_05635 [bacterium]|nr:hypothetical protein [bacterium]
MKKLIILIFGLGLIIFNQGVGFCYFGPGVGARALGMGGAFVSVAEGIDACYWNPAGLGNMKEAEVTIMRTMNNRDAMEYQEWLAAGTKIGDSGGLGVNYVHFKNAFQWVEKKTNKFALYAIDDEWVGISVGGYGGGQFKNLALGVNLRNRNSTLLKPPGTETTFKWSECTPTGHKADFIEYDLGVLYRANKELSLGVIIQNCNEKTVKYGENSPLYEFEWRRNITPGVAWRPDEKTIFAIECYNPTLEDIYNPASFKKGQSEVRIGFERWCTDKIAVRAGLLSKYYHTIGVGVREIGLKKLFPELAFDLDYALLEGHGMGTHFLSCTAKF